MFGKSIPLRGFSGLENPWILDLEEIYKFFKKLIRYIWNFEF